MGGFLQCPKCNKFMFLCFDHDVTPPIAYHECSCGYNNRNMYYTNNSFLNIVMKLNKQNSGDLYGRRQRT